MLQPLPTHGFKWLNSEQEVREDVERRCGCDLERITPDNKYGYVLEVDLEYPTDLHDAHNDYPLAPENMLIEPSMLSPLTKQLQERLQLPRGNVEKLTPNLLNKTNYIVHYRNLQYYLQCGLRLTRIHRAVRFQQRPWMKPYIDFNTSMRAKATTSFEKDLFKLLNNAVFGESS